MVIIRVGLLSTDNYKWLRLQTTSTKQEQIGKSRRVAPAVLKVKVKSTVLHKRAPSSRP